MDKKVIGNRQRGFVEDRLCLAALFPFWNGVTGYVDGGGKQLVWILTLPRPLTQPPKVSRSCNYALDGWLSSCMEFLQDLRVMVKGLKLNLRAGHICPGLVQWPALFNVFFNNLDNVWHS